MVTLTKKSATCISLRGLEDIIFWLTFILPLTVKLSSQVCFWLLLLLRDMKGIHIDKMYSWTLFLYRYLLWSIVPTLTAAIHLFIFFLSPRCPKHMPIRSLCYYFHEKYIVLDTKGIIVVGQIKCLSQRIMNCFTPFCLDLTKGAYSY